MADRDPQALAERLFTTFLAPVVLGGDVRPGKPIGGRGALAFGEGRTPSDPDLVAHVTLARVRVARTIVPIDLLEPVPSGVEWALAAVLHDVVQATHPGFDAALRRRGPERLLAVAEATLARIAAPTNAADALSRHTWLSRMFEIARTDTELRWWTGSARFLGEKPPQRLLAWPEVRRVHETTIEKPLLQLPRAGAVVSASQFEGVVETLLEKTPLGWFSSIGQEAPTFRWTPANLGLAATRAGRTMAVRMLDRRPEAAVATALGRATRMLAQARQARALAVAVDVLRERVVAAAELRLATSRERAPMTLPADATDAAFALAVGAMAGTTWLADPACGLGEAERAAIAAMLAPASRSAAARELLALIDG